MKASIERPPPKVKAPTLKKKTPTSHKRGPPGENRKGALAKALCCNRK
jgi:hypothetical protein